MLEHSELKICKFLNFVKSRFPNSSIICFMGRTPHIAAGAKPTTVYLTRAQKVAIRKLQTKRLESELPEPGLTEVFLEGFALLLKKEDWPEVELGKVFPKRESPPPQIRVFPKRREPHKA